MQTDATPFDENAIGANLGLTVSDTILQTTANVDAHRHARSRFGQTADASAVEFYIYSPNGLTPSLAPSGSPLTPSLMVGIVTSTGNLAKYVGESAGDQGYCPGDGHVYSNGVSIASFATCPLNTFIGVRVNFIELTATWYTVKTDGTRAILGTTSISASTPYWYAATVSGIPGDLAVWANAGQTPLRWGGEGWFHKGIGITPLYLATEPYITSPNDVAPDFKYNGDIERMQNPLSVSRGVGSFWPFGASKPPQLGSGSKITFTILDPNKIYGELISLDIRD